MLPAFAVIAILIGPKAVPWMLARTGRDRAGKEVWTWRVALSRCR